MDEMACNYDADATMDGGACEYPAFGYDCYGVCIDTDGDGVCDIDEEPGCMDNTACNYDADATDDDGSCEYTSCLGCIDMTACNYDADATIDDGSCDFTSCLVCMDETACNYDENATISDVDLCEYADEYYDCDGNCINDTDGDGVCDENEELGCTDPDANNYDETATDDDGSCCYLEISIEVVDPLCNGDEGTVTVTAEGGSGEVTFQLGDETNTTGVFSVGATDEFTVTASDENLCSDTETGDVSEPDAIVLTISDVVNADVDNNGSANASATGGTGDLTIVWLDAASEEVDPTSLPAGSYTVTASDDNLCSETETVDIVLGIEDIDPLAFNMFPNPTTGTFYLQIPQIAEDVTLTIVDGVGRTVYSEQLSVVQGNTEINLSTVAAGTYSVMLSGSEGTSVRRLSIMR